MNQLNWKQRQRCFFLEDLCLNHVPLPDPTQGLLYRLGPTISFDQYQTSSHFKTSLIIVLDPFNQDSEGIYNRQKICTGCSHPSIKTECHNDRPEWADINHNCGGIMLAKYHDAAVQTHRQNSEALSRMCPFTSPRITAPVT